MALCRHYYFQGWIFTNLTDGVNMWSYITNIPMKIEQKCWIDWSMSVNMHKKSNSTSTYFLISVLWLWFVLINPLLMVSLVLVAIYISVQEAGVSIPLNQSTSVDMKFTSEKKLHAIHCLALHQQRWVPPQVVLMTMQISSRWLLLAQRQIATILNLQMHKL